MVSQVKVPLVNEIASVNSREPIQPLLEVTNLSPARVALGHELFNDVRLSKDNSVSCATFHVVPDGGDDGTSTSTGIAGRVGNLNAPTVLNSSLSGAQFQDGRARTLVERTPGPIHSPLEMDSNWDEVISKLAKDRGFVARFTSEYQQGLTPETIVDAIVTCEHALVTVDSPFDRYLLGDDQASEVNRGRINFTQRIVDLYRFRCSCITQYRIDRPIFSQREYRNTGGCDRDHG